MVATPSYITIVSNPERNLNKVNIFGANLYSPGLNFTLPGIPESSIREHHSLFHRCSHFQKVFHQGYGCTLWGSQWGWMIRTRFWQADV